MCGHYIIEILRNTWHSISHYLRNIPLGADLVNVTALIF